MTLHIATNVELPDEVATEAIAILARRGRGKTYTAAVLAEELYAAGQPFVVLDPTGAWWGLRSDAGGKKPGLPVTIIGGEHGDVPLEPAAGKLLASFVVDNPGAFVLDLSGIESNAAQDRFVTAFAERLYRAKSSDRRPLTLIVDEADSFAPQRPLPGQQTMLGAFESIVRRGRIRGLGVVLITQRPAVLNKNVLTQAGLLVLLGITSPQDRGAIDDWVKGHAEPEQRQEVLSSLARLDVGEAWLWWPTEDTLTRATIRRRRTFDSSSTPKAGEARESVAFARVDLDALKESIADTIEKAKAEDPALLKARIRELEAELRKRPTEKVVETVTERVEVPVLDEKLAAKLTGEFAAIRSALEDRGVLIEALARFSDMPARSPAPASRQREAPKAVARPATPQPRREPVGEPGAVSGPQRKLLTVLATYGPRTKRQLAMQAGYSAKGGGFNNPLSALRSAGYVEKGDPIVITETGLAALGEYEPLPVGQALLDHWMAQLSGPERKILQSLIDAWPQAMTKEELAEAAGYAPVGGGFNNPLSRLRTLELVTKGPEIALTNDFAEAITDD